MICQNCQTENRPDRKFCLKCGQRLASTCPNCGTSNEPQAAFCGECGTQLTPVRTTGVPWRPGQAHPRSQVRPTRGRGHRSAAPSPSRSGASCRCCSPISSATRRGRSGSTARRRASCSTGISPPHARSSSGTAAPSRSSSAMPSWPSGAHRPPTRTMPSVPSGRALTWSPWCRASDPIGRYRRRSSSAPPSIPARLRSRSAPTGQGMVAGDVVNTASRLQSAAAPGTVLVGESTMRAASGAIAFEPVGEQALKGKQAPVAAWRAVSVVGPRRWRRPQRPHRAAVRRSRRRIRSDQGAAPRDRRGPAGAPDLDHGRRRDRQEPPGVGVAEVPRRRRRSGVLASRPVAGLRRGSGLLGARRDGPTSGGHRRAGRCRLHGRQARGVRERVCRGPGGGTLDPAPPAGAPGARGTTWRPTRRAVRRLAALLRTDRRAGHDGSRLRGPAMGRRRPGRVHRVGPRVVPKPADPHRDPRAAGALRSPPDLGCRPARHHGPPSRPAAGTRDVRARRGHGAGSAGRARRDDRRPRRGRPALRGGAVPDARRSRPDPQERRRLRARRYRRARAARIAAVADRGATRLAPGRRATNGAGWCGPRPVVHAPVRLPRCPASRPTGSSPRCATWSGASSCQSSRTLVRRSADSTASSAR